MFTNRLLGSLVVAIFFFPQTMIGQEEDKMYGFKGQVHAYGETLKGALIEVYDAGDLVHESYTKGGGKFSFELKGEREYMMDISMEDMRTKTIWINTKHTRNLKSKIPDFGFDVYLKKEKITRFDELSELPVTLIKYDVKRKAFYMDKTYEDALKNKEKQIENDTYPVR
tara:strand:+ start:463 stop:969 length:507 start_codon:yes stop_codon:yes gene_type:complete